MLQLVGYRIFVTVRCCCVNGTVCVVELGKHQFHDRRCQRAAVRAVTHQDGRYATVEQWWTADKQV